MNRYQCEVTPEIGLKILHEAYEMDEIQKPYNCGILTVDGTEHDRVLFNRTSRMPETVKGIYITHGCWSEVLDEPIVIAIQKFSPQTFNKRLRGYYA